VVIVFDVGVVDLEPAVGGVERAFRHDINGMVEQYEIFGNLAVLKCGYAEDGIAIFSCRVDAEALERTLSLVPDAVLLAEQADLLVQNRFLFYLILYVPGRGRGGECAAKSNE